MDSEYVKRVLGRCLAEGLSELLELKPPDPIEFLSHWILQYKHNQELMRERSAHQQQLEEEQEHVREESLHQKLLQEEQNKITAAQEELMRTEEPVSEPAHEKSSPEHLPPVNVGDDEVTIDPGDPTPTDQTESDTVMEAVMEIPERSDPPQLNNSTAEEQKVNNEESDEDAGQQTSDIVNPEESLSEEQDRDAQLKDKSEVDVNPENEAEPDEDSHERQTETEIHPDRLQSTESEHADRPETEDTAVRHEESADPEPQSEREEEDEDEE
ncbi:DPY30 domain containing 2 isoform X1 [Myxocyprinus asiaticus]|uniref:DPY30 domain containing 2 isoform X1 n=2 Tax=Myxocyprinus asiaticus TaxID=70543 RepID=UPI002221D6A8|nr:DPY30 domain containing 2 isoform X1 [Myxocyprinus asiaticus]